MSRSNVLNLFYLEPDPDRWVLGDRFPRKAIRRLVRGPRRPGGQTRVYLNLRAGLDLIGVPYRVNDFKHAMAHPDELVCIIGKPFVLDLKEWRNPILFGAATFSHPLEDPEIFERLPVQHILVPGPWMERMCKPYWGERVQAWPVGIDTRRWRPGPKERDVDVLLYDKVLWNREDRVCTVLEPIREILARRGLRVAMLRYGAYREEEYEALLKRSRSMIFLCEHETQGIAYQQALSCDVPILAWDREGFWEDPAFYPHLVRFGPASSVPYFDQRCGERFRDLEDFEGKLDLFSGALGEGRYRPREFVEERLTLEGCARDYRDIATSVQSRWLEQVRG